MLPTAHDMSREYRVLSALAGTEVPVPVPVALYPEPDVIGAPFYLMQYVPGLVLRSAEDGERLSPVQARQLSEDFTDMLAAIHGVDLAATGLSGFGRPEGYMERQLARWQRQWELSASREVPGYTELTQRLAAGLPGRALPAPEGTLVHGDYRLDNTLVTLDRDANDPGDPARPAIAAVLDWEMSTLGDPLADLGLALVYWTEPEDGDSLDVQWAPEVTTVPGVPHPGRDRQPVRRGDRAGRERAGLLHGLRVLQARRGTRGHPRPVPAEARRWARGSSARGRPSR